MNNVYLRFTLKCFTPFKDGPTSTPFGVLPSNNRPATTGTTGTTIVKKRAVRRRGR